MAKPVHHRGGEAAFAAGQGGDDLEDVEPLLRGGRHNAGVRAVGEVHHRADDQRGQYKRPKTEAASVDRQEEDTRTNAGAEERNHPREERAVRLVPGALLLDLLHIRFREVLGVELGAAELKVLVTVLLR